jgi:hypothetical protein
MTDDDDSMTTAGLRGAATIAAYAVTIPVAGIHAIMVAPAVVLGAETVVRHLFGKQPSQERWTVECFTKDNRWAPIYSASTEAKASNYCKHAARRCPEAEFRYYKYR